MAPNTVLLERKKIVNILATKAIGIPYFVSQTKLNARSAIVISLSIRVLISNKLKIFCFTKQ